MSSLYENLTFENLMESALSRVDSNLDKREGSMIYNGVAPAMAELAQLYIALDFVFSATYLETAPREYLILRAKDYGFEVKEAKAAEFRAEFNIEVPINSRFSCEDLNFYVSERMAAEDTDNSVSYRVICETAGSVANNYFGTLIPIEYIDGLKFASIVELLVPGNDEEETETLRQRVMEAKKTQAFGGNQADYKQKVLDINGVTAVKIHPVWNSDISPSEFIPNNTVQTWFNSGMSGITDQTIKKWITAIYTAAINKKLTVGGSVKIVIMGSGNTTPSDLLIETVQTSIDPTENAGEGLGFAPIGHVVKVEGVLSESIDIDTEITFKSGYDFDSVKTYIENVIDDYFDELSSNWENNKNLIVRISQIESRILQECSEFIDDITNTKLNGIEKNISLGEDSIPVRGVLTNG